MKRSNLLFFIEQIVDLSIANQSVCDGRRENEARIKKLEVELTTTLSDLKLTEKARVKWKERCKELETTNNVGAAEIYQKELVKAERENKILANELLAITNQTGTKARPKISISHDGKNAQYVIDKFVDFDHPHTIDILAKHEARMDAEEEMHSEMIFDQEPTDDVHTRSSSSKLAMVEEIRREQMQNDILDEVARKEGVIEDAEQMFREEGEELERMHNMDCDPPEPTPEELMEYCKDRIQEFIREDLSEAKSINHVIDIRFIPKE
tara:strand:- start:174 stop:974 length:801 start_codon:yes stop_codon:yes gene_type:complete